MSLHLEQEVWANAHETRDNVSLVSYAGCLALSPCSDFGAVYSWNVVAAGNREIVTKTPILGVQGRSRSSMLVAAESSSAVTVMISRESVSIWNRSHARLVDTSRRANSGKITIWCLRSRGISSPAARSTEFAHKKLEAVCHHMVETRCFYFTWAWFSTGLWRTDRRTDKQNSDS